MPDPFAHGTPAGDDHTWVDPGQLPCPNCSCCLRRLCDTAREAELPCSRIVAPGPGVAVDDCPCAS